MQLQFRIAWIWEEKRLKAVFLANIAHRRRPHRHSKPHSFFWISVRICKQMGLLVWSWEHAECPFPFTTQSVLWICFQIPQENLWALVDRFLHIWKPKTKLRHQEDEVGSFGFSFCSWIDQWCRLPRRDTLGSVWIFCGRRLSILSKMLLKCL